MSFWGLNLRPGVRKTCGPSGTSSHTALTQVARFLKGYMLSGKDVYFCNGYYLFLSVKSIRICIPASEAIAGQLGEGVEEILSMKITGKRTRDQIESVYVADVSISASDSRPHQI